MRLAVQTTSFTCDIADGLARMVLNQARSRQSRRWRFLQEFSLAMAELSERDDVEPY